MPAASEAPAPMNDQGVEADRVAHADDGDEEAGEDGEEADDHPAARAVVDALVLPHGVGEVLGPRIGGVD